MTDPLAVLREQILELDTEIVRLLCRRMQLVQQIGRLKKNACIPVIDPGREDQVLNHVCSLPHSPLSTEHLMDLYRRIISISREMQLSLFSEK